MSNTEQRLATLRKAMAAASLDALVIPRADEYLGEYIPAHNERLHWLTGFTGSAGVAIVLAEQAALFVDGRYTVQVRDQVDGQSYAFHHLIETPQIPWLIEQLPAGARVGCDPRLHTLAWYQSAQTALAASDIKLVASPDNLIDQCWSDRPEPIVSPAILLEERYTGETSASKRTRLGKKIGQSGADAALVFQPDAVSWLLNVRGTDMPQLPVLLSLAILQKNGDVDLFVDDARLPSGFVEHVGEGVTIYPEQSVATEAKRYAQLEVIADPAAANAAVQLALTDAGATLIRGEDPALIPKACKNAVEQAGSRAAHKRDAVAVIRFLHWLDTQVANGAKHTEATLSDKLFSFRSDGDEFHAGSFDTISAAGANAAMCHYNHLNGEPAALPADSLYLVDSGGQYTDGTTDITRTVAIGAPDAEAKRLFTLVLKGHIALATARFPKGTTGTQLDVLARQYLWSQGFDYDHGTGHGVGVFLSVHEGPQRISKAASTVSLQPGMIVSNEPGYYRDGVLGIRCENLVLVQETPGALETPMLEFETISLVPFDRRLLDTALLNEAETDWLNAYHARVEKTIGPMLDAANLAWLKQAAAPL
ncbi:MAG: aminopeptidase P family protein [Halioglobus sp.]